MKLLYATSAQYPSTRANRIQTLAMARAYGGVLGDDFTLGILEGERPALEGGTIHALTPQKSVLLAWRYARYVKSKHITHVLYREERLGAFLIFFLKWFFRSSARCIFEVHFIPEKPDRFFSYAILKSDALLTLTHATHDLLRARGVSTRISVAPDGVDLSQFSLNVSREESREILGLPQGEHIVLYCGHLYPWKGVDTLARAAAHMPLAKVYVVGGAKEDLESFRARFTEVENLSIMGYRPHTEIPVWLRAADVVVLPTSGKSEIGRIHTSPLKLFEYMVSETPIVASDVSSTREVLGPEEAELVLPDDPHALAEGILKTLTNTTQSHARASLARRKVSEYGWDRRASRILSFIQTL